MNYDGLHAEFYRHMATDLENGFWVRTHISENQQPIFVSSHFTPSKNRSGIRVVSVKCMGTLGTKKGRRGTQKLGWFSTRNYVSQKYNFRNEINI